MVPHARLIRKLRLYGIQGHTLQWISSFLRGRTQSVMVDGVRSHTGSSIEGDDVASGVPQGTVMGPLLFLLYINNLPSVLDPSTSCRLFADDCLIYRSIKSLSDQVTLQRDLEALHDWGELWGLKFNVAKCKFMHLDLKTVSPVRFYTLGGEIISSVTEAKYLGVTLSSKYGTCSSQWKPHITEIATKANQRLGFLRRNLGGCPYRLRELGYISLVRSLIEYSGGIWDTTTKCEADMLEAVQRRAARWAREARGIISVTALLNELNWQPLSDRRRDQRLSLFYKILHQNLNLPPESVDLRTLKTRIRKKHKLVLERVKGSDKHSPYWKGPICITIPTWNNLEPSVAEAGSFLIFKSQLAHTAP